MAWLILSEGINHIHTVF